MDQMFNLAVTDIRKTGEENFIITLSPIGDNSFEFQEGLFTKPHPYSDNTWKFEAETNRFYDVAELGLDGERKLQPQTFYTLKVSSEKQDILKDMLLKKVHKDYLDKIEDFL